uniref:Topoisomerase 2-associated protein PAT1 n=1 Tax=Musca domestica TaxID=7370 RepID=T1PG47_MUSDO
MVAQWKAINDNYKNLEGYKRVAWPPANEERVVREFTPQPHAQYTAPLYAPQAQEQNQPQQHQQQYQPNAAVPSTQPQQQQQPPQQNVQNVSHGSDQLDNLKQHDQRGASPGIITLRKEAPISQAPAPVYTSQPAAVSFQGDDDLSGGSKLRGDLKWPPPEYKEAAARENEERRQLALGPVCRPRKVNRDYSSFFAKNALSHHYPSYKVPPGTQHVTY